MTRDDVANFVLKHADRIRTVARTKLTSRTKQAYDSEDVVSSVLRCMDEMAAAGSVRPASEAELWSLIKAVAGNRAVTKTRLMERAKSFFDEDGDYARVLHERIAKVARQFLGVSVLDAVSVPLDEQVSLAVRKRTPFVIGAPRCAASGSIAQLAIRLEQGVAGKLDHGGFFNRMSRWFRK